MIYFLTSLAIEIHLNMGMALLMRISETDAMIVVAHQASEKWNVNSQNWTYVNFNPCGGSDKSVVHINIAENG